jgi:hypothetical protein
MKKYLATIIAFLFFIAPVFVFSATDIVNDGTLSTNLQGCWDLDEESGTRVDQTANSNDLTDVNTVLFGTGIIDNAADFEHDNTERLTIADGSQTGLDMTGDMTISFWVKVEARPPNDTQWWMIRKNAGGNGYQVLIAQIGTVHMIRTTVDTGGTGATKSFNHTLSTSAFTHIVFRFTSSTKEHSVWINGAEQTPQIGNVNPSDSSDGFAIGGSSDGNAGTFDGLIDVTAVWSLALSDSSIGELYNSGTGIPCAGGVPPITRQVSATTTVHFIGDVIFEDNVIIE